MTWLKSRSFYLLRHYFSLSPYLHILLVKSRIAAEALSRQQAAPLQVESVPLRGLPSIPAPQLRFIVARDCRKGSVRGLTFDDVDFFDGQIRSWFVPSPPTAKTDALFRRFLPKDYAAKYLGTRLPFMGRNQVHRAQFSKSGHICASNGFYNYVIDTNLRRPALFPADYLDREPMFYAKQGNFSGDGGFWYFVRWPLNKWIDVIDKNADSVPCQVGKYKLDDGREEILLTLDFKEDVHEVAGSPDDRYVVFSTFKQELVRPYPRGMYFRVPTAYNLSHQRGLKLQDLITVDLSTRAHWRTRIPAPAVGHCVFDPDEPDVFYLSAHNLVNHQLSTFLQGPGTIFRMRIGNGQTLIMHKFSDPGFLRIFQHEVFKHRNETYVAVMSYTNHLYVLRASDLSLHKKIVIGPPADVHSGRMGISPCLNADPAYFSVNASVDGKHLLLGSTSHFVMVDMETDRVVPMDKVFPEGFGLGKRLPHTKTYGK